MKPVFVLSVGGLALGSIGYMGTVSGHRSPEPKQPAPAVQPAYPRLPVPPPGEIKSVHELVGAHTWVRNGAGVLVRAQIHEFMWGITREGNIGLAVLKAVMEDGTSIDYDHPERYVRLVDSPEGLDDTYFAYSGGTRVAVERIGYRIDEGGMLATSVWIGRDKDGRSFVYDDLAGVLAFDDEPNPKPPTGVTCCRSVTATRCVTDNGCTAGCAGPTSCACTSPAGSSCYLSTGAECSGACGGICHNGSCGGTPPSCACHI
jgi:hypothetical protein